MPEFRWAKCSVGSTTEQQAQSIPHAAHLMHGTPSLRRERRLLGAARAVGWRQRTQSRRGRQPDEPRTLRPDQLCQPPRSPTHRRQEPRLRPDSTSISTSIRKACSNPEGFAGSQIRKAVVGLPEGFTINPSLGAGLGVCTPSSIRG